ncbi:hypothetical protein BTJ40_21025 [Microbulbifer sp. A4B17]|uniref:hypothetical protein n=1 Tax=Microbulbifer sp. A4B17 TaxID=359370 RepID=UPI000D52AD64|nr:hypothetical protein [Microbulbifer sp. A4B17]AWF83096.1 hypothetical protein BTJ40_21025 [Microbulbifer sp. A4B17]
MTEADSEKQWLELESVWKQQPVSNEVPAEILKWVRRQERRMRMVMIFECSLFLITAIYLTVAIWNKGLPDASARLLLAYSLLAFAVGFSWINRRGLWSPLEETTQAYVDLALLRLKRKRREVHFIWMFLSILVAAIFIWQLVSVNSELVQPLIRKPKAAALFISLGAGLTFFLSTYVYWRTGREKSNLEKLQKKYLN